LPSSFTFIRVFRPSIAGLILAGAFVFCLVPAVRLSQPECHEYAAMTSHGDGAPAPKCLDGTRTLLSVTLPELHFTNEFDTYRGWGWGLDIIPLAANLLVGSGIAYFIASIVMFGLGKLRMLK